jgi:hypothetical protein
MPRKRMSEQKLRRERARLEKRQAKSERRQQKAGEAPKGNDMTRTLPIS